MTGEDHDLIGWEVEGATIAAALVVPTAKQDSARSTSAIEPSTPAAQMNRKSLRDVKPLTCGPILQPFSRAEIADEMFDR